MIHMQWLLNNTSIYEMYAGQMVLPGSDTKGTQEKLYIQIIKNQAHHYLTIVVKWHLHQAEKKWR